MTKFFLTGVFLLSSLCFAGGEWYEKGNAGFLMSCPATPFQALDLHELENRYKDERTLDTKFSDNEKARVEYLISKIERLNPNRAQKYREWYSVYEQESEYVEGGQFERTADAGKVFIPVGCSLLQVVFRREPSILNKARYTVNKDLWVKMQPLDRAAIVLHELIYREFSGPPNLHETSEFARYFNALVNSQELLNMSEDAYFETLRKLKVTADVWSPLAESWTPRWGNLKAYWPLTAPQGAIQPDEVLKDYFGKSNGYASGAGMAYGNAHGIQGVTFDGLHHFNVRPTSPANVCGAMTWMTWVKWNAPAKPEWSNIITNWRACDRMPSWNVNQAGGTKKIEVTFNTSEVFNQYVSSMSTPLDGAWHHIAVTLTATGAASIYIDGEADGTLDVVMGGGICNQTEFLQIGGPSCTNPMGRGGTLSEMAIWDAALTANEVADIFKRQKSGF